MAASFATFCLAVPPAAFVDRRYLAVALGGGLVAFLFGHIVDRSSNAIDVLDAAGLGLFAVTGVGKALALGTGPMQAIILGPVTGWAAERCGTC